MSTYVPLLFNTNKLWEKTLIDWKLIQGDLHIYMSWTKNTWEMNAKLYAPSLVWCKIWGNNITREHNKKERMERKRLEYISH